MRRPRQQQALRREHGSLNLLVRWRESPAMAMAKCRSIFRSGAQYQRLAATNRARAAAARNTKTAAAEWRSTISVLTRRVEIAAEDSRLYTSLRFTSGARQMVLIRVRMS